MIAFNIAKDTATPEITRLITLLKSGGSAMTAGRAVATTLKSHFNELEQERPNKRGFHRTHFWSKVRQSVQQPRALQGGAVVSITHAGIAQRLFGGKIKPDIRIWLTIANTDEAYGSSAREFDLKPRVWNQNPGVNKAGGLLMSKDGKAVMYWLLKEVDQKPDPTVLPTVPEMAAAAVEAVEKQMARRAG